MKNQIKLRKAIKSAGMLPMATNHIISNIPESVISALTGTQIAELMVAMHKHFVDGQKHAEKELHDYIGLPSDVSLWAVMGDSDYLGIAKFSDGLHIPNILEARGREVKRFELDELAKEAKKHGLCPRLTESCG